jgi:hypothetical protein
VKKSGPSAGKQNSFATAAVLWFKRGERITSMLPTLAVLLLILLWNSDRPAQTHFYHLQALANEIVSQPSEVVERMKKLVGR